MRCQFTTVLPVAMAQSSLHALGRWCLLRELIAVHRQVQRTRGPARMFPALLSKRLRELEEAGVVARERILASPRHSAYRPDDAGTRHPARGGRPIGMWGHEVVETEHL